MKKLLLVLSVLVVGLSGCYVEPYRDHDEGYHRGHDHDRGESGEHRRDHDEERGDRHGDHDGDR